jgi:predicted nucleic acid-binding protein
MSGINLVVLDASVLVAFMRPGEPSHSHANALIEELTLKPSPLFVPAIAFAEVAAALARGENDTERALNAVMWLGQLRGLKIVSVDEKLGGLAVQIAARQRIRGCDAVYVALARRMGVPLITLDRQQRERASTTVRAYTPAEALTRLG